MIEETGTIVEIKENVAVVLCRKSSMCENCASIENCRMGRDADTKLIEVHNLAGARVGDDVKIATSTRNFLQSSFLLYVLPLIFLVVGAVAGQLIGERLEGGPDPNLLSALLGVACLVSGFLVIGFGSRAIPPERFRPHITEVLSATHGSEKEQSYGN